MRETETDTETEGETETETETEGERETETELSWETGPGDRQSRDSSPEAGLGVPSLSRFPP